MAKILVIFMKTTRRSIKYQPKYARKESLLSIFCFFTQGKGFSVKG